MENYMLIQKNCLVVFMPAEIDHSIASKLQLQIDHAILDERVKHVVFDYEKTTFMDSSGIGLVVGRYQKINKLGGVLLAIHLNERMKRIMKMSALEKYIHIVEKKGEEEKII